MHEAGKQLLYKEVSYISYAFPYFHEKGLFKHSINATQMLYFMCYFQETQLLHK